jgi:hypothetical protein
VTGHAVRVGHLLALASLLLAAADPAEVRLVGAKFQPPIADELGEWDAKPGPLSLQRADPGQHHVWLPVASSGAVVRDGLVRARFSVPHAGKVAVLVRADAPTKDPGAVSGYALTVSRSDVVWGRFDKGRWRPLHKPLTISGLLQMGTVEIHVLLAGEDLSALVLRGDNLELLGAVRVRDRSHGQGRVGWYVYSRKGVGPALEELTLRHAQAASQGPVPAQLPGALGEFRFVEWMPRAGQPLPAMLAAAERVQEAKDARTGAVFKVDPGVAELLERQTAGAVVLDRDVPLAWLDASFRAAAASPVAAMDAWRDAKMVEADLRALARRHSDHAEVMELGRTHLGLPILALRIANPARKPGTVPRVLVTGGIHGDELLSVLLALDAAVGLADDATADSELATLRDGLETWIVPLCNPDGVRQILWTSEGSGRKNARDLGGFDLGHAAGVDLNRNFPTRWGALGEVGSRSPPRDDWYRGPQPASEPETRALMQLAERERFVAAVAYHTWGTVVLAPYQTAGLPPPEPDEAWSVAQEVAKSAPVQPNGRRFRVARKIYDVDGVEQDWLRHTFGTVALLVEGAVHNPMDPDLRRRTVAATRPTWVASLRRVLAGPRVSGRVVDATGRPVSAEVRLVGQQLRAGERWTSRCPDGRFDRLLPAAGTWRLRVGDGPASSEVEVRAEPVAEIEVQLAGAVPCRQ